MRTLILSITILTLSFISLVQSPEGEDGNSGGVVPTDSASLSSTISMFVDSFRDFNRSYH